MNGEDVTLGEVARKLDDLRAEFREARAGFVPRGEYEENRKASGERVGNVEKDVAEIKTALATINRIAWTGVVLPVLVAIMTAIVLAALGVGR